MNEQTPNDNKWKDWELPPEDTLKSHKNFSTKQFPIFFPITHKKSLISPIKPTERSSDLLFLFNNLNSEESKINDYFTEKTSSPQEIKKNESEKSSEMSEKAENKEKTPKNQEKTSENRRFFDFAVKYLLIRKFLINLRNSISSNLRNPSQKSLWAIGDKGFLAKSKSSSFVYILEQIPLIRPDNIVLILYENFLIIVTFAYFILFPLNFGLNGDFIPESIQKIAFLAFFGQIGLGFLVKTIEKGEFLMKRGLILRKYLKTAFLSDFLLFLFITIDTFAENISFSMKLLFAGLFYLISLEKIEKKTKNLMFYLNFNEKTQKICNFIKALIFSLLFVHIFACFWLFFNKSLQKQYFLAFYEILLIITTNGGLSDNKPEAFNEKVLIIIMFLSFFFIIFYWFRDFSSQKDPITKALFIADIPYSLKLRVANYYEDFLENEKKNRFEIEFSTFLSEKLKMELFTNAKIKALKQIPLFKSHFSHDFFEKIAPNIKKLAFLPGEILISKEKALSDRLFILIEGEIELFIENNRKKTVFQRISKKNSVFGVSSLISGKKLDYLAQTSDFSSLYVINKQDFMEIIKENPTDYESFCSLRDLINFDGENIEFPCEICQETRHNMLQCPDCHLVMNNSQVISRKNLNFCQKRQKSHIRKVNKSHNSRKNFLKIKEAVAILFPDSSSYLDLYSNSLDSCSHGEDEILKKLKLESLIFVNENTETDLKNMNHKNNDKNTITANRKDSSSDMILPNSNSNFDSSITSNEVKLKNIDKSETSLGNIIKARRIQKLKSQSLINLNGTNKKNRDKSPKTTVFSDPQAKNRQNIHRNLTNITEDDEEIESEYSGIKEKSRKNKGNLEENFTSCGIFEEELVFDISKEYQVYYKHNNFSVVEAEIEKLLKRKRKNRILLEMMGILFPIMEKIEKKEENGMRRIKWKEGKKGEIRKLGKMVKVK